MPMSLVRLCQPLYDLRYACRWSRVGNTQFTYRICFVLSFQDWFWRGEEGVLKANSVPGYALWIVDFTCMDMATHALAIYRWVSARKTYLQCVSNGVTPFLHEPIDMSSGQFDKNQLTKQPNTYATAHLHSSCFMSNWLWYISRFPIFYISIGRLLLVIGPLALQ